MVDCNDRAGENPDAAGPEPLLGGDGKLYRSSVGTEGWVSWDSADLAGFWLWDLQLVLLDRNWKSY